MFEPIMIALIAAYVALIVLGHVLLIAAIYQCARDDRPRGNLVKLISNMQAHSASAIRRLVRNAGVASLPRSP